MKLLLIAALLALGGCGSLQPRVIQESPATLSEYGQKPAEAAIKQIVASSLKDPDSIKQYQLLKGPTLRQSIIGRGWFVCVVYNAKNSFGAYGGATEWIYVMRLDAIVAQREMRGCWKD